MVKFLRHKTLMYNNKLLCTHIAHYTQTEINFSLCQKIAMK